MIYVSWDHWEVASPAPIVGFHIFHFFFLSYIQSQNKLDFSKKKKKKSLGRGCIYLGFLKVIKMWNQNK